MSSISELFAMKNFSDLYVGNEAVILFCVMLIVFYPFLVVIRKITSPGVNKISKLKGRDNSKIYEEYRVVGRILHICTVIYLLSWGSVFDNYGLASAIVIKFKNVLIDLYIIYVVSSTINTIISVSVELYKTRAVSKRVSIDLHAQIIRMIVTICAMLAVFSLLFGLSIGKLFTSIGAAAALLTFVFKDTVLGLLASLQLTYQDVIKVGDWVTLPSYNADGNIEKITITVIRIRNFDNTYTTVPTYAFLTTGVRNWRSMFENGGRRIKRSISIDMDTINILKAEDKELLSKNKFMAKFIEDNDDLINSAGASNATIFRHYITYYLKHHQDIHKDGFTFLVRQLQPLETGLPIELYVFTKDTAWANYESIQADIFDHILAVMPMFGLRAFQSIYGKSAKLV